MIIYIPRSYLIPKVHFYILSKVSSCSNILSEAQFKAEHLFCNHLF
nr:MAG TPA: hypothetical protein [Caudoviricetes sp.]